MLFICCTLSAFEYIYLPFIGRAVDFLSCLCLVVCRQILSNAEELGLQFFSIAAIFNICLATLFCTKSYLTVSPESFDSSQHFFHYSSSCLTNCFK